MIAEKTEVIKGREAVQETVIQLFKNVRKKLDICSATFTPNRTQRDEVVRIYFEIPKNGGRLRLISNITKANVDYCKTLMKNIEIRHRNDVSTYFGVSESEFVAAPGSGELDPSSSILYSNEQPFVKYQQQQFDMLWDNALPVHLRIKELELGNPNVETKIIQGEEDVTQIVNQFLSRAATAGPQPYAFGVSDMHSSNRAAEGYADVVNNLFERYPDFEIRLVTDVQNANLEMIKNIMSDRYKIKHIDGNTIRFTVSRQEYIETISSKITGGVPDQIVWSNDPQIIAQAIRMFEALWNQARPAQSRIMDLEEGKITPVMDVIYDPAETRDTYLKLVVNAKKDILLLLPTATAFHRHESVGLIDSIRNAANRGVQIKLLTPVDEEMRRTFPNSLFLPGPYNVRNDSNSIRVESKWSTNSPVSILPIPPAKTSEGVSFLITDRSSSLVIEERAIPEGDFNAATGLSTYSTSPVSVRSNIRFIERVIESLDMIQEMERALQQERISRRQAELMQDILTHDIRNYNQIARANIELLQQKITLDPLRRLLRSAISAIDGSTELIQKARLLSGIMNERVWSLHPVDLRGALERSLTLVRQVYQNKVIEVSSSEFPDSRVLADSLLDEVFVNILSNAVKYTDGVRVPLEINLEEIERNHEGKSGKGRYWRVMIVDQGRGIPEELKPRAALRYQGSQKTSGLGLSIAHGLVVNRYSGRFELRNRLESDYTKGTKVELWLPSA